MTPQTKRKGHLSILAVAAAGLGLAAAAGAGCGEGGSGETVTARESAIIGGSLVDVATRRDLGLIDVSSSSCAGALITPDWVLTAARCINFAGLSLQSFRAPRPDGTLDERRGLSAVQAGSADIGIVRLAAGQAGNQWPSVSRTISGTSESSMVGQNITCYGRGDGFYDADGVGTRIPGWRAMSRPIAALVTDPLLGDAYRLNTVGSPGSLALTFNGDYGANCFTSPTASGQVAAVYSTPSCIYQGQGQPNDPGCNASNVTSITSSLARATVDYRQYLEQVLAGRPAASFRPLNLANGWMHAPFASNLAAIAWDGHTTTMRGAIASGTTAQPFTVPLGFRPTARVYIPVTTVGSSIGRLVIEPTGAVTIEGEGGGFPSTARSFTSLEGVSYLTHEDDTVPLSLIHGWTASPFGTRTPAAKMVNGVVHLMGAIVNGSDGSVGSVPPGFAPLGRGISVPIGLCDAAKGSLIIHTTGAITVRAEDTFDLAQCFTSLEGVAYPRSDPEGTTSVALQNGWQANTNVAGFVRFRNEGGIVRFQGGALDGTARNILRLPLAFRPATNVWVPVDLGFSKNGRIKVQPDGWVSVDSATSMNDAGFVSLEGVSFGL